MMIRPFAGVLLVLLAGEAYLAYALEGPSSPVGALMALVLLIAPGMLAGLGRRRVSAEGWVILGAVSFGMSTLAIALAVPFVGFEAGRIAAVLLAMSAGGWIWGRRRNGRTETDCLDPDADEQQPGWACLAPAVLAALCLLAIVPPFARIGRLTPDGYAFRTYFDHDFLVHLSVVGELGRGMFPPQNPYFGGEPLHYYWFYFLFPALARKIGGGSCSGPNTLIFCNVAAVSLFAGALCIWLKTRIRKPLGAALCGALVLFCGSFEGSFVLGRIVQGYLPAHVGEYNVDGATRWYLAPPQIDALLRGLLYTHQHVAALAMLLALGLVLRRREVARCGSFVFWLLLPLPGMSGFVGLIGWAWLLTIVTLDALIRRSRSWREVLVATVGGMIVGWVACSGLGMFGGAGSFVKLMPRAATWRSLGTLLLLNFGAIGLLGLAGAWISFRLRSKDSRRWIALAIVLLALTWIAARETLYAGLGRGGGPIYALGLVLAAALLLASIRERRAGALDDLALGLIGLGAILTGFIPGYVNEFGLRGGFVVALSLGAFTAHLGQQAETWGARARLATLALTIVACLAALPTTLIDLKNSLNLLDPRFITYVSPREAEALAWMRDHLPSDAVVQGLPNRTQRRGLIGNVINALGERRMAVGKTYYAGQFQVGEKRAEKRAAKVTRIFGRTSRDERLRSLLQLRIGYLTIGLDEREAENTGVHLFRDRNLFEPVFDNEEVLIYRVNHEALARAVSKSGKAERSR